MMNFVGIDFGTTNSVVSYLKKDEKNSSVEILEIGGSRIIPTVIFFDKGKKVLIGKKALEKYSEYPNCGARVFKRSIGSDKTFSINTFSKKLREEARDIKTYFIVDTNVFINNLEFEEKLKFNEYIVLPNIVEDKELPYRGGDGNTDIQSEAALERIDDLVREERLYRMDSDEEYIPSELRLEEKSRNDKNDNKIFSIAYKLKSNGFNGVLLTGDRALRNKAKAYDIQVLEPNEFLEEREDYKREKAEILSSEDCSMIFLRELKKKIDKKLNKDIENAVITVPANFDAIQRGIIEYAAKRAGFINIRLEDEPVAAVAVYGEEASDKEIIGVYDFGGGTFDFSIIQNNLKDGVIEVKAVDGDKEIGGENFTTGIVEEIIKVKIEESLGIDNLDSLNLSKNNIIENENMMRIKAEEIKRLLSNSEEETCSLEGFYINDTEKKDFRFEIVRVDFNEYVAGDIIDKTEECIDKALEKANLMKTDIDKIVLAGGTSCIPEIQERIKNKFGKNPIATKDLATIVSEGAVILGKGKFSEEIQELKEEGKDGGITVKKALNNHIGVEVENGVFYTVLNYGERIPCKEVQVFEPIEENQEKVKLKIYSKDKNSHSTRIGEEGIRYIGMAEIGGIEEATKGEVDINVTFEVDRNEVLRISARLEGLEGKFIKEAGVVIKI